MIAFYNGTIYTADPQLSAAEAFSVENGRFAFVGRASDLPKCTEYIDLEGACVIPGLIDSHCHMFAGVTQAAVNMLSVDPKTRPEELDRALRSLLKDNPAPRTETICAMGIDLTVGTFSAKDIDAFDRPVMVFSNDGHALLLNTRAMEELGIRKDTRDPGVDSYYVRDPDGYPTGLVIEIPAMLPCRALIKQNSPEDDTEILRRLALSYSRLGYTSIFEAMSVYDNEANILKSIQSLDKAGRLPLRISTSFCYHGEAVMDADTVIRLMKQNRRLYSSENVSNETLKIITDGTVEEHSALLYEPYADSVSDCGSELMSISEMNRAARLAAKEGFSVHIHAIGDQAVTRALDALCDLDGCEGTRTIAHNQLYTDEDIARIIRDGNIFFQTTPHWMKNDNYTLRYLGRQRFENQFPVGTMQRGGVTVTFGSDSCLDPETANAFSGMFYACARGDASVCKEEALPPRSESISRMESLLAYTSNAARQLKIDHKTGSISAGKSADFAIISHDLIRCPLQELKDIQVLQTWFGGNRVI